MKKNIARTRDISIPIFHRNNFERINQTAKSSGLSSDDLLKLCSCIESEEIDKNDKLKCIECLIPTPGGGTIPEEVCIRLTYVLKASRAPIAIKVEILKWMVCAHSFMETRGRFQALYEMFFMFLKNDEMRSFAAHFLSLITQKKHVTFRRFNCLLRFIDEYGHLPCFTLLLRVFFFHAPEYFDEELTEEYSLQVESLGAYPSLIRNVHHEYSPCLSNALITTIENNSTAVSTEFDHSTEQISSDSSSSKLSPFYLLYKQFTALERSTDISKILQSKWRRLFFTSHDFQSNPIMKIKSQDYIISMLHNSLDSQDIVERHLDLYRLQRSLPGISDFTEFLFKNNWSPDIGEVMCFEPICCFKKIQYKLQLFRKKFLSTEVDVGVKCQWLNSLSKMYCYWILQSKKPVPCDGICNKDYSHSTSHTPLCHIPLVEITQLGTEIDSLCDSLIMEDCSPFVLSQILEHYEMGAIAHQLMGTSSACFPSPSVFQLSLFSLSTILLETLSGFMLRINAMYDSKILRNNEIMTFQASMNDIKKIFLVGSYKSENTYLAKTQAFKHLKERSPDFISEFILHKHPAFLLIAMEFGDGDDPEDFLSDPDNKKHVFLHLGDMGCQDFIRLISCIKIT